MSALLDDSLVIVLAGGAGERLYPLTKERAKPAVFFGGPYRIIDFALSNCINSGLRRIFIATQYKSLSLNRHIRMGWGIVSEELGEFVEILPPQKRVSEHWYQGTADAVYQNLYSIMRENPKYMIVLSGDHVYKMEYSRMLRLHQERAAAVTLATIEVSLADAVASGSSRSTMRSRWPDFGKAEGGRHSGIAGLRAGVDGRHIFDTDVGRALEADAEISRPHDFAQDIIPALIPRRRCIHARFTTRTRRPAEMLGAISGRSTRISGQHGSLPHQRVQSTIRVAAARLSAPGAAGSSCSPRSAAAAAMRSIRSSRPAASSRGARFSAASCARTCGSTASATSTSAF
jgi:glucose-1-phosphate adenylyltransferase